MVYALLDALGINTHAIASHDAPLPDHRVHLVAHLNGVDWYNDSKSTVMEATLAAVAKLAPHYQRIILLLGGVSKGVDRTPYLHQLAPYNMHVICFGKESALLATACLEHNLAYSACETLAAACTIAQSYAQPGDAVLLSPGGASFDLFTNYEERGKAFVNIIQTQLHN